MIAKEAQKNYWKDQGSSEKEKPGLPFSSLMWSLTYHEIICTTSKEESSLS